MNESPPKNAGLVALLLCVISWVAFAFGWYLAANSFLIYPAFLLGSIPFGIAAIVIGRKASVKTDHLGRFARTGMILGCFWALALAGSIFSLTGYIGFHPRAEVSRARSDLRNLAVCLESYILDQGAYPPAVDGSRNVILAATGMVSAGYVPPLLTTPFAYVGSLPPDPFPVAKGQKKQTYRYATDGGTRWVLSSNGPDGEPDAEPADYPSPEGAGCNWESFVSHFGIGKAIEYDPTNGDRSRGDIIRVAP